MEFFGTKLQVSQATIITFSEKKAKKLQDIRPNSNFITKTKKPYNSYNHI